MENQFTKEQLKPEVFDMLSEDIGDLSALKTEDKSSAVNAVNEIVGKGIISSVIGFPLLPTDSFVTMGYKIDDMTEEYKVKLKGMGVDKKNSGWSGVYPIGTIEDKGDHIALHQEKHPQQCTMKIAAITDSLVNVDKYKCMFAEVDVKYAANNRTNSNFFIGLFKSNVTTDFSASNNTVKFVTTSDRWDAGTSTSASMILMFNINDITGSYYPAFGTSVYYNSAYSVDALVKKVWFE